MIAENYKKCTVCKEVFEKTEEFFHKYKQSGKEVLRATCRTCHNKKKRNFNYYKPVVRKGQTEKMCTGCKKVQSVDNFSYRTATLKGGLIRKYYTGKCKHCKAIDVAACKLARKMKKEAKEGKGTINPKFLVRGNISNSLRTTMIEN